MKKKKLEMEKRVKHKGRSPTMTREKDFMKGVLELTAIFSEI